MLPPEPLAPSRSFACDVPSRLRKLSASRFVLSAMDPWKMRGFVALGLSAGLTAWALHARPFEPPEQLVATEPEFQVNTYTTDTQSMPDVSRHDNGFVVTWTSAGSAGDDSDDTSIQARLLDAEGLPLGGQFQINESTTGAQFEPSVAAWSDGGFVVTWVDMPLFFRLRGKIFDSTGTGVGSEFLIAAPSGVAGNSVVAADDDSFVVTWSGYPGDGDASGVRAARYSSDGTELSNLAVNSFTTGDQSRPTVSTAPDSTFLVVWVSDGSAGTDTAGTSVQMRRLSSEGAPLGEDFQVNSYTTGDASSVRSAFGADGGFLVSWTNVGGSPDGDDDGAVVARRFDSSGMPVGDDFQINDTQTLGSQASSDLDSTPDGGYLVSWSGDAATSDDPLDAASVIRRLDAQGEAVGDDFVVNTLTLGDQVDPRLDLDDAGNLVVVWTSDVSAGDDATESIQGRFVSVEIFADGFESGDTAAWSATVN